jgi:hypothetical protein
MAERRAARLAKLSPEEKSLREQDLELLRASQEATSRRAVLVHVEVVSAKAERKKVREYQQKRADKGETTVKTEGNIDCYYFSREEKSLWEQDLELLRASH